MRTAWLVVMALSIVSCGNAPSCKDAVAKAAAAAGDTDPELVKLMTAECEKAGWTGEQRTCLANATSEEAVVKCLSGVEVSAGERASEAHLRANQAELQAEQAMKDAKEAAEKVQKLAVDLDAMNEKVSSAVTAVVDAQNDADRAAAKVKLQALQKEKAELEQRIAEAKAASDRAERSKGVHVSKECLDNPLAKGCQ
jgi:hypothetical protein